MVASFPHPHLLLHWPQAVRCLHSKNWTARDAAMVAIASKVVDCTQRHQDAVAGEGEDGELRPVEPRAVPSPSPTGHGHGTLTVLLLQY